MLSTRMAREKAARRSPGVLLEINCRGMGPPRSSSHLRPRTYSHEGLQGTVVILRPLRQTGTEAHHRAHAGSPGLLIRSAPYRCPRSFRPVRDLVGVAVKVASAGVVHLVVFMSGGFCRE